MKTEISNSDLERFVDGESTADDAARIEEALDHDPALADTARQLRRLNQILREDGEQTEAPSSLRAAVTETFDLDTSEPLNRKQGKLSFLNRRTFLTGAGGTLAAGVAGIAVVSNFGNPGLSVDDVVETFFHDYQTFLAKDRAIDISETSMLRLAEWYGTRLSFSLPPIGSSGGGASLLGGRLCWLLDRRLASLSYQSSDGPLVLYVMESDGINLPAGQKDTGTVENLTWHRSSGSTGLVWKSEALVYVMVGQQELRQLLSVARALVG